MGFSFRSLYNDEDSSGQGHSSLSTADKLHSQNDGVAVSRAVKSGIPGPLKEAAPAKSPVEGISDDSSFYSLDALEPELSSSGKVKATPSAPSSKVPLQDQGKEKSHEAQITLRAVFATSDSLTLDRIAALTTQLPGITSCIIKTSDHAVLAKLEQNTVCPIDMAIDIPRPDSFQTGFDLLDLEKVDGLMFQSESSPVSCFSYAGVSLMARHSGKDLEPGLWEKLILITKATAELH